MSSCGCSGVWGTDGGVYMDAGVGWDYISGGGVDWMLLVVVALLIMIVIAGRCSAGRCSASL